jgi:hypothetical protein
MPSLPASWCVHVAEGIAPILLAAREEPDGVVDAEWRFRCGGCADPALVRAVSLEAVIQKDPSAIQIVLHPRGTVLERRDARSRWHTVRGPLPLPPRPSRRWPGYDPRYAPRPGEALDSSDLRLLADVSERGFHVLVVEPEDEAETTTYAFSVGLFRSFDHPEVALFGLPPEHLADAIHRVGERVRGGTRLEHGAIADRLVEGRLAAFRTVAPRHYPAYLGYAVWYHGGPFFPALQCIWSDTEGRFPWAPWFPRGARNAQPMLFEPEPA